MKTKSTTTPCNFRNLLLLAKDRTHANCAVTQGVSGPRGHDFALMGLSFIYPALPACLVVYVQKSDFQLINVFRVVIVVKNLQCLAQVVFSYFVLHSSKIPLVLTTKDTHLRSLLFRHS